MGARTNPARISVNQDLADARPLSPDEFIEAKDEINQEEEVPLEDLSDNSYFQNLSSDEQEFYRHVVQLAKNIDKNGQKHPVTVREVGGGELELISGYSRCLACRYSGNTIKYEKETMTDSEALEWMYSENASRHNLDPERRAVLIAKNMNRWDDESGGWVPENDLESNPNVSKEDAMTIAEFAEKTGKNRGLIYQQLSPLRQNSEMRDEFGEEITETSFQLIERICDETSEQYTLAQALSKSSIETHSKFQSSYKLVKKQADDDDNLVNLLCRRLIGLEIEETQTDREPSLESSRRHEIIEERTEEIKEKEEEERQEAEERLDQQREKYGHSFPDPDKHSSDEDKDLNIPEDEDEEENSVTGSGAGFNDESGTSVLPPVDEQPFPDRELEITIPGDKEIAQLVRQEAENRDRDPSEFVANVLQVHFRKTGKLKDTPEAEIASSD